MKRAAFIGVTILAGALPALAEEAEHGGHGAGHGAEHMPHVANWWGLGGEWAHAPALGFLSITFLVFVGLLYAALKKPLGGYIEQRSNEVKNALEEAQKAKREAEAKAREYEERLSKLDGELDQLKSDFKTRGEAEMKRLEAAGKAAAERILKDAEDTIAAEFEKAQTALKLEASRLALDLAEDQIRGRIAAADHMRLEQGFIADVAQ
jgi:F-type H+-transporting ATPase subunit b